MHRYLKLLYAVLIGLAIFTIIRLVIFTAYFDLFKENSGWSILLAILHGIRFDASIFLTIISPLIVLLLLPVNSQTYQKIIYWIIFAVYAVITIYLVIDAVYFGYVSRHLAGEFAAMGNDYEFIWTMAKTYFYMVFIVLAIIAVCGFFWKKFADIKVKDVNNSKKGLIKSAVYFILIGGVVFIFIRGSFGIKPINTINAFVSGNNALANLTLNGLFTSLRYMTKNETVSKDMYSFYDDKNAHDFILSLKHENCTNPFADIKKPNIVFVLLESWSSYYVDAFSGSNMQLTPNFNKLSSEGIMFTNHYSPERRSISAIQAILLGIPPMDNIPKLGFGLETIAGSGNLALSLNKNGYNTIFIQASKRNSFYLDVIAKSMGFEEYYGMEDTRQILNYPDYKASQFGWDYETYMKLAETLKNKGKEKPFFAFLFTGTTHIPYAKPNEINIKFPHDTGNENGFKNTLVYADWSLGEFIKQIEKEEYFKNTIFIFTADHVLGNFEKQEFPNDFKVPLLVWSPSIKENKKITATTNHVDLPPTILSLADGGKEDYREEYIGENIFCKDNNSYSIIHTWGSAAIIQNNEWLKHSFKYMLENNPKDMDESKREYLSKILLSYYQESYNIMTKVKK